MCSLSSRVDFHGRFEVVERKEQRQQPVAWGRVEAHLVHGVHQEHTVQLEPAGLRVHVTNACHKHRRQQLPIRHA